MSRIVVIFTGSRYWTDKQAVVAAFEHAEAVGIHYVVTGDQTGLDRIAYEVARERGHRVVPVHAWWEQDRHGAGLTRNEQMVDVGVALAGFNVGLVKGYAFPDKRSIGTWRCVDNMVTRGVAWFNRGTVTEPRARGAK